MSLLKSDPKEVARFARPTTVRYQVTGYALPGAATSVPVAIECAGARRIFHLASTDQGGATGVQIRFGIEGDEWHTVQGDLIGLPDGITRLYLRNTNAAAQSGKLLISWHEDFFVINPFQGIPR